MKIMPKLAILESLDTMDHVQMEKVLQYIKEVLHQSQVNEKSTFRKKAMEQIRSALRSEQRIKVQA